MPDRAGGRAGQRGVRMAMSAFCTADGVFPPVLPLQPGHGAGECTAGLAVGRGAGAAVCGAVVWPGGTGPAGHALAFLSAGGGNAGAGACRGLSGPGEPVAVPAAAVSGLRGMAEQHGRKSAGRGCGTGRRVLDQRKTAAGAALCLPGNAGKVGTASSAARPSRGAHGASLQV